MNEPSQHERSVHGAMRVAAIAGAVVVVLSAFYVAPRSGGQSVLDPSAVSENDSSVAPRGGPDTNKAGGAGPGNQARSSTSSGTVTRSAAGLSCPANNGGKTDVGIDSAKIRLASTEVRTGIGQSFLGSARYGMLAVVQKTNRQGGICGRQIELDLKDDGWDPNRGKQFLNNLILSNSYFALAVVPSSNGLDAASRAGDIDKASDPITGSRGIPVVGTDGMLNSQYTDPWIWPVAASTATTMRIVARDALERGKSQYSGRALRFGIVYDQNYPFGPEGAGAFVAQAQRDGATVPQQCREALTAGQNSYGTQVKDFNDNCGEGKANQVDFVALLLEPQTAETWLRDDPFLGTTSQGHGLGFAGPQPLFDQNFVNTCGQECNNMAVWTSFYPPIDPFVSQRPVQIFKADLCSIDSSCEVDSLNAFTQGAYVGMLLMVEALKRTSPFLTRDRLRQTLDSMILDSGLTEPLAWKAGNHYANVSMVAFRDTYSGGAASFQFVPNSQRVDPCRGCKDAALGG